MNKGRNILLLMIVMLGVSILAFLTLFERSNTHGVVDGVRYIVVSEQDGVKSIEFYFPDPDALEKAEASEEGDTVTFVFESTGARYVVDKKTGAVTADPDNANAFDTYSEKLFDTIVNGKKRFMQFWQAIIVAVVCIAGGLVILFAEEIWHVIKKKGPDEIPAWKDMNGIKLAGGGVIALGVFLAVLFILI